MDLVKGALGPEGSYDVVFADGMLKAELKYAGQVGGAGLFISIGVDQIFSALEAAIPGQIDDVVLEMIKGALKAKA